MPMPGTGERGTSARFAVGKPSSRPRPSPRTTAPSSHGGRPSSSAAASTEPAPSSSRIREDEIVPPAILQQRLDMDVEAQPAAGVGQPGGRALRALAVAEVLPHADVAGAERLRQHLLGESVGVERRERAVEAQDDELVDPELCDQRGPAAERGELDELHVRPQHRDRRRVERDHGRREAARLGRRRRRSRSRPGGRGGRRRSSPAQRRARPAARPPGSGGRSQHHHRLEALSARLGDGPQLAVVDAGG